MPVDIYADLCQIIDAMLYLWIIESALGLWISLLNCAFVFLFLNLVYGTSPTCLLKTISVRAVHLGPRLYP